MKLFIVLACVGVALADRLDNTYLPPSHAYSSGGNGNFLSTPRSALHHGSPLFNTGPFARTNFNGVHGSGFHPLHNPAIAHGAPINQALISGFNNGRFHGDHIPILRQNSDSDGFGGYRYEYETANGISAQETGQQKVTPDQEVNEVQGSYSYTAPDGQQITVHYTADENGFHPQGDHIPTSTTHADPASRSLFANKDGRFFGRYPGAYHPGAYHAGAYHPGAYPAGAYHHPGSYAGGFDALRVDAASRQYLAPKAAALASAAGYHY